ncbi:proton-coupled zinc antiporter SLC30A1-like [Ruditapes philippinarum]|uniref:proton-coupled zinc antiporter SLC30A1-like n=1 Tax=Ruditapes philippinarum TaxID=129788 RepID=UPI00295B07B1|nr:proton-coupled zinc antiporter SLC30A1-like [Ruditapes philippinarum]XP_060557117.1 proton-coupled zinc antiporter SLC30A1-like [Ruditapes philippinarum]XP_060557118.1 proton-coupled zinc antiporter SLC30A1-like [Ruditapes philippinarum]XP_060557119.1 proton-coupled zinc antiporter SLC30A1-like [Ruditapes philippinarum]
MGKYSGKTCRLLTILSITTSFFVVEIIVGYITNSLSLVADSFHILSHIVALIVGFVSVRISKCRSQKNTFGWERAEIVGALVNSVFLIALCFSILVYVLKRLVEIEKIENPKLLLIVGCTGLLINFLGLALFYNHDHSHVGAVGRGHNHGDKNTEEDHAAQKESETLVEKKPGPVEVCSSGSEVDMEEVVIEFDENSFSSSAQLNMRAVFLHVLGDALGSVIVVISALVIWFVDEDWVYYVDPGMSIVMVFIIFSTTIPLLKKAALILLQAVPTHIQVTDIKDKMMKIDGVEDVHEFHVWQLAGNRVIASAHIGCRNPHEYMALARKIIDLFHDEGIHSTTIQPEFSEDWDNMPSCCVLACGPEKSCYLDTCCAVPKKSLAN